MAKLRTINWFLEDVRNFQFPIPSRQTVVIATNSLQFPFVQNNLDRTPQKNATLIFRLLSAIGNDGFLFIDEISYKHLVQSLRQDFVRFHFNYSVKELQRPYNLNQSYVSLLHPEFGPDVQIKSAYVDQPPILKISKRV